jgi:hypothetical protein
MQQCDKRRYHTLSAFKLRDEQNAKMILSVMAVRTCKVTCRDPQGVEHTVEVSAQTRYEAVAQALRVFREYEWCDLALAASVFLVGIRQPEVEREDVCRELFRMLRPRVFTDPTAGKGATIKVAPEMGIEAHA